VRLLTLFKHFILSLIGTASALGQVLEIPIIIRSLAGSFAFVKDQDLPLEFNDNLLLTLDAGECKMVSNYELMWWIGRKPKDINTVEILDESTVGKCIVNYRQQTANAEPSVPLSPAGAGAVAPSLASLGPEAGSLASLGPEAGSSNYGPGYYRQILDKILQNVDDSTLVKCLEIIRQTSAGAEPGSSTSNDGAGINPNYRQLLSDVLQDVVKFQRFASLMSTSTKNHLNLGIRRTAAFNLLHEAAVIKETAGTLAPAPAPLSTHLISAVTENASSELTRLQNLPPSSYKWTWGETLTEKEVIALRQSGTNPGRAPHSGYDVSLREGNMMGEESAGVRSDLPSLEADDMAIDPALIPPPTDLALPSFFSNPDFRHVYNPLHLSNPSISPYLPEQSRSSLDNQVIEAGMPNIAGPEPSPINMADNWSDKSGPTHQALQMADNWSDLSGSEPSISAAPAPIDMADNWSDKSGTEPLPGTGQTSALTMADQWLDNDRPEATSVMEPAPTSVFALADQWLDNDGPEPNSVMEQHLVSPNVKFGDLSSDEDHENVAQAGPSNIHLLAVDWEEEVSSEEGLDAAPSDSTTALEEWSFGPEHFSFLKNNMFDNSDEEILE
jgi:hypothetical protein